MTKIRKFVVAIFVLGLLVLCVLMAHQAGASGNERPAPADPPHFADVTEPAGVAVTVDSWGASWGDFDSDGFPDLYAGNHHKPPGLFHNNGDGTFTDIVEDTPLNTKLDRHGVAWGDYDNDGDLDLVMSVGAQGGTADVPRELYRNDNGDFVDVAEEAGVSDGLARGRSVSWADYDRDGDLDFFAANQFRAEAPNRLWRNNGDGTFTDVAAEAGVADSLFLFAGGFVDYDRDGWPDIFVLGLRGRTFLYHNNGDGTFEDVSAATGFADQSGNGYAWGDYDGDGDADLFIGTSGETQIDHVEGDGQEVRFIGEADGDQDGFDLEVADRALEFELELKHTDCHDLTCIHIGRDGISPETHPFVAGPGVVGRPDYTPGVSFGYYIWRDKETDWWHVRWSAPGQTRFAGIVATSEPITSVVPIDMEPYIPPSGEALLWRNKGDGTFEEVSAEAGLSALGAYGTGNWVDFDNDGWLDLFVVNKGDLEIGNAPNHLFRNKGDGTFEDVAALVGVAGTTERSCNVSAWADFDQNGFLDLFTMNGAFGANWPFDEGPNQLFHNEGNANHWLQLELVGRLSNRLGLGAVVTLSAGGRTQVQTRTDGSTGYNQDGGPLQFGLGDSTVVDTIVIDWPSRVVPRQVLTHDTDDLTVDQRLIVVEPPPAAVVYLPIVVK